LEYLKELKESKGKNSRIKLNKINDYIQVLSEHGTNAGEPYMKHLDGDIWELRPGRERILFAWVEDSYVLLHRFMKETQKTPSKEMETAKRRLDDFIKVLDNE
jgi:phage-related protein